MIDQILGIIFNGAVFGFIGGAVAAAISPLQFLKVIRQQTGNGYLKVYKDTIKRSGFSTFFRGAKPYALMNFLSSMAFGVSEYIAIGILTNLSHSLLFAIIFRATMGGLVETLFSVYFELKEIAKNKGSLMQSKAKTVTIFLPILLRNTVFWYGSVITYELSLKFGFGIIAGTAFAFLLGSLFAIASIPLDVIATQSCGAKEEKTLAARFKEILKSSGPDSVFAGTLIRIIQVGIFTITTVGTMLLIE